MKEGRREEGRGKRRKEGIKEAKKEGTKEEKRFIDLETIIFLKGLK